VGIIIHVSYHFQLFATCNAVIVILNTDTDYEVRTSCG